MQCPTHKAKLTAIPVQDEGNKPCNICSRKSSLKCSSCKFVLCSQCRICNLEHGLIKIVELSKVKPEYYNNSYSCNACSKSKVVTDNGIWHCNQCNYDICEECAD